MCHRIHEESETSNLIENNVRLEEDYQMFRRYWPEWIAKILMNKYKDAVKTNLLRGKVMEKDIQFRKNFIWNVFGTGFNAFNSLFFLIAVTRINGVDNAGIFTIAYSTACIIYVLGIYAGRIYQVTEPDKSITNKEYIVNRIISVVLMSILVLAFCFIRGYDGYKILIFFLITLFRSIEAFSEVFYGVLQKNEKLEYVGKSLFVKSLLSIIVFVIVDILTKNMELSICSIIITWVLFLILYDFRKSSKYIEKDSKINWTNVMKIFKRGFTTFAIAFLGIYIINAPKYAIDNFLPNDVQTVFGIIVMPATVVSLVSQFLIHPFLNQILKCYEERDLKAVRKILFKLVGAIAVFGLIAAILAYFIGTQVLGLLYGLDLGAYKWQLLTIIIAATLYTIGIIHSSVLTTVRDTFSQFVMYIIISIFTLIVSDLLTKRLQLDGAVWAYLATMGLQFLLYVTYTNVKLKKIFSTAK